MELILNRASLVKSETKFCIFQATMRRCRVKLGPCLPPKSVGTATVPKSSIIR